MMKTFMVSVTIHFLKFDMDIIMENKCLDSVKDKMKTFG